jgi:hypothetical protein
MLEHIKAKRTQNTLSGIGNFPRIGTTSDPNKFKRKCISTQTLIYDIYHCRSMIICFGVGCKAWSNTYHHSQVHRGCGDLRMRSGACASTSSDLGRRCLHRTSSSRCWLQRGYGGVGEEPPGRKGGESEQYHIHTRINRLDGYKILPWE